MRKILLACIGLLVLLQVQAQSQLITGKVTAAASNEPLTGVSVTLKGSFTIVQTNDSGIYRISVPNRNGSLVFKSVGFKEREVKLGANKVINVSLETETTQMNDVVVIGYATVRRRDLTGSISSIGAKQLKDIPINSAEQALAGRLAGVQVTAAEGSPDANVTIRIRGGGSITQDNSPLYVIDGVQVENGLAGLSPQDIESIDVLKDASATAIYGARGANGVVLITTKGGKEMKTTISYNGLAGISQLARKLDVMSPYDFVVYQYERNYRGDSTSFKTNYGAWSDLENYKTVDVIDWQDKMMGKNAIMQTHNVGMTGGTKATQYNLSLTRNTQDAIVLNSGFKRYLVNFKFDHQATTALKVGFNVRYNNQAVAGAGTSDEGGNRYNMLRHSIKFVPYQKNTAIADDEYDDEYFAQSNQGDGLGIVNPVALSNAQYRKNSSALTNLNGYANLKIVEHLNFRSTFGVNFNNAEGLSFDDYFTPQAKLNGAALPMASVLNSKTFSLNNSNVLTYTNKFNRKHDVSFLLGQEIYNTKGQSLENKLRYFPFGITPEKAFGQLSLGTNFDLFPVTRQVESRILSFFSRGSYSFRNKYLATFTIRGDGSSKFASGNRWGYFPSASLAWRISDESFMKKIPEISSLKLRVSYGEAGNNRIGDYLFLNIFTTSAKYALNEVITPGYATTNLANKNLRWETTVSRNLGVDIGVLANRIQLSVDVYRNSVNDVLINVPIPSTSGYSTQLQNVGGTSNRGVEFQLNAYPVQTKNFTWNSDFNISFNKNRIEKISGSQNSYLANSGFGVSGQPADFIVKVGEPLGSMWGYVTNRFYTVADFDYDPNTRIYTLKQGIPSSSYVAGVSQPGSIRIEDVSGDGKIGEEDKMIIGNANPKFTGGFNNQLTYKQFDLSIFVNFVYGNSIFNANKIEFTNSYSNNTNMLGIMADRWRIIDADGNFLQSIATVGGKQVAVGEAPEKLVAANPNPKMWQPLSSGAGAYTTTSWAIEDGSFLRINNVSLGYTFNSILLKRVKISRLRVYGTVNNLAIITRYTGYDPEVNTRRAALVTPGVDYSAYPRSRTFIAGVNLSL